MSDQTEVAMEPLPAFTGVMTPDYTVRFHRAGAEIGCLDFNGPAMTFTGDAEQSAKMLFDWVAVSFAGRLEAERAAERERLSALPAAGLT